MQMNNFKSYSFSRLLADSEIEFFLIVGLVEPDNFNEYWDGTGHQGVGYLVMFKNHKLTTIENLIYLLPNSKSTHADIKRYTYHFAERMISADMYNYDVQFKIKKTSILGNSIGPPYIDFIRSIVGNDVPAALLKDIAI